MVEHAHFDSQQAATMTVMTTKATYIIPMDLVVYEYVLLLLSLLLHTTVIQV